MHLSHLRFTQSRPLNHLVIIVLLSLSDFWVVMSNKTWCYFKHMGVLHGSLATSQNKEHPCQTCMVIGHGLVQPRTPGLLGAILPRRMDNKSVHGAHDLFPACRSWIAITPWRSDSTQTPPKFGLSTAKQKLSPFPLHHVFWATSHLWQAIRREKKMDHRNSPSPHDTINGPSTCTGEAFMGGMKYSWPWQCWEYTVAPTLPWLPGRWYH